MLKRDSSDRVITEPCMREPYGNLSELRAKALTPLYSVKLVNR